MDEETYLSCKRTSLEHQRDIASDIEEIRKRHYKSSHNSCYFPARTFS
jgi:hypothetical protein